MAFFGSTDCKDIRISLESSKNLYNNLFDWKDVNIIEINAIERLDDLKFAVFQKENIQYVCFRGSNSIENWCSNIQYRTNNYGAHSGIAHLERLTRGKLKDMLHLNKPTVFSGHSLGGAIAIMSAFWLNKSSINVKSVYTFGSPRFCKKNFANYVNLQLGDKIFRFVNENDIVPTVPLWVMGFRHVGTEIWKVGSKLYIDPSYIDYFSNFRHVCFPFGGTIKAHSMEEYTELCNIESLC